MTPEEELQRAAEAEEILGRPLFKEAFREVETAILEGIKLSPIKDADFREKCCQQYIQLHAVVGRLRTYMETGKLAEATLQEKIRKVVNW